MTALSTLFLVTCFALVMSALNWLLFVIITVRHDLPALDRLVAQRQGDPTAAPRSIADGQQVLEGAGILAGAFRRAGAGPTAAAMSLACLVLALIAAGIGKV